MKNKFNIGDKVLCGSLGILTVFTVSKVKKVGESDCFIYNLDGQYSTYGENDLCFANEEILTRQYMNEIKIRLSPRFSYHKFLSNKMGVRINPAKYSFGDVVFVKECDIDDCFFLHIGIVRSVEFQHYGTISYGVKELTNSNFCMYNSIAEDKLVGIKSRILCEGDLIMERLDLIERHLLDRYSEAVKLVRDNEN